MRYRHNSVYELINSDNSNNIRLSELEEIVRNLSSNPSNTNNEKIEELFKLIEEQSNKLKLLKDEENELFKLLNNRIDTLDEKINRISNGTPSKEIEILLDELITFKEKQELFNSDIYEKIDDIIDRINDLIDFINSLKDKLDLSNLSNEIPNSLKDELEEINYRLLKLESNLEESSNEVKGINESFNESINTEKIIEEINENQSDDELFNQAIEELEKMIEDEKNENEELTSLLEEKENDEELAYNKNWLEEFEKLKLSLEDDGIYEYEIGEDMKNDFYGNDLPNTKIVKVSSNELVRSYSNDDINNFIGDEARKLASKEIDKIQADSELTQKAWLANNQRINEMSSIIERQEEEIRRLSMNSKISSNEDITLLVSRIIDEKLGRISNPSSIDDSKLEQLRLELENQKIENARLRSLLESNEKKSEPVVNIYNTIPEDNKVVEEKHVVSPIKSNYVGPQKKKRKQKFFFEIKEHNGPKITKADLDREKK